MAPTKYRKLPVEIEAMKWDGDNEVDVQAFAGHHQFHGVDRDDRGDDPEITASVFDVLHATWMGVKTGQWVIRGIKGEFYPCDDAVFAATYEAVTD